MILLCLILCLIVYTRRITRCRVPVYHLRAREYNCSSTRRWSNGQSRAVAAERFALFAERTEDTRPKVPNRNGVREKNNNDYYKIFFRFRVRKRNSIVGMINAYTYIYMYTLYLCTLQ